MPVDQAEYETGPGRGELGEFGLDQGPQQLAARGRQRAGEHDQAGVEHGGDGGETGGEPLGVLPQQLGERGVPLVALDRTGQQPGRDLGVRLVRGPDAERGGEPGQRLGARKLLEAAAVRLDHLAYEGCARHRQETDLARTAGETAVQPAVDDEGGAEALLVPQEDEVLVLPGRAEALFGHRDQVHVVLVLHRHRQGRGQLVQQGGGVPAGQVRGVAQASRAGVEGAGGADDDPVHVRAGEPGLLDRTVQGARHLPGHALGPPPGGGQFELADGLTRHVGDGGDDPPGGHIEPRHVGGPGVDRVELGVGPRPPLAGAGGDDQPGGFQPGEEL